MATHSSTLAWKTQWTEEPGRLQSMGSQRVEHNCATSLSLFTCMHWRRKLATHSSVPPWRIPGMVETGGLPSMGLHRVGHDSDLAAAAAAFFQERVFSTSTEKCVQIGLILCFTSQPIGFLTKPHLSVWPLSVMKVIFWNSICQFHFSNYLMFKWGKAVILFIEAACSGMSESLQPYGL